MTSATSPRRLSYSPSRSVQPISSIDAEYRIIQVRPAKHPADAFTDACTLHVGYMLEDGVQEYSVVPLDTEGKSSQ